ncbi:MAG TPA: hypothetical protein VMM37_01525 [Bacteroidota bacterium]|nr:hypothetical protein [Bacteroidota bacterium]
MKLVFSLLISVIYVGCSSSSAVSSFDGFNADAEGRDATIVFRDGRELDVQNVLALPDSTHFWNEKTHAVTVVPTHTIKNVVLTNHFVGFLEGVGFGAIGGVAAILAMGGGTSQEHGFGAGADVFTMILAGAAAGGLIGGIPGVIIGHSYEYEFAPGAR